MKVPDKIYIHRTIHLGLLSASEIDITGQDEQYIRKGLVDEMVKTAEDHAYFAGQEKLRGKLLEWAKEKAEDYKGTANIRRSFELMIRKIESL